MGTKNDLNEYLNIAKPFYSERIDHFHNYAHAEIVNENGKKIIKKLWLQYLKESVNLSTAFHDTWYHHPEAKDFPTKEDYSIHILQQSIQKNLISDNIIRQAIDWIEGTKIIQIDFTSNIRKILRAADINNLWGHYDNMLQDTIKIYYEYSDLNKKELRDKALYPLPRQIFQMKQSEILIDILHKTKKWIPEEFFLHDNFYEKMKDNIDKLSEQSNPL